MPEKTKLLIGRLDRVDLPEFDLENIDAKIDTGAYTSSLHCNQIRLIEENGVPKISFHILGDAPEGLNLREYRTANFKEKLIRSSFGQIEKRFVIRTKVILFGKAYKTDFSLSDRTEMRYPILLGRRLLRKRFIVDVSLRNLSYKLKKDIH
jgi:hypothetical protein